MRPKAWCRLLPVVALAAVFLLGSFEWTPCALAQEGEAQEGESTASPPGEDATGEAPQAPFEQAGDEILDLEAGREADKEDVLDTKHGQGASARVFSDSIPPPSDADEKLALELEAYRLATQRYAEEVHSYLERLSTIVSEEYVAKLDSIDGLFARQIEDARARERNERDTGMSRLEEFLAKHGDNERYAPGVLYRLAVLHYEKADDEYYSADPETLTTEFPDFTRSIAYNSEVVARFPDFPQIDGVYYLLGFCLSQMEQEEQAKDAFMALVEKMPESAKAPEAYTRIGEYYFALSQDAIQGFGDSVQWDKARDYYERAAAYGPDYAIYDRALYRLAWTEYYVEDYDSMIHRFIELVDHADKVPDGSTLREEAIEFMAAALAEEDWNLQDDVPRDPDFGMVRFDRYLNTGKPFELEVLRAYVDTLAEQSRYDYAVDAYKMLLVRDRCNPENPKIHQALIGSLNLSEQ